ncbi:MAG TPA: ECF transporter S component [Acidothermaceae bacterium]|jgi:energy-coupling factor transport system substrate-specific component
MTVSTVVATTSRTARRPAAVGLQLRSTFALAVASGFGVLAFGWPFLLHSKAQNVNTAHTADAPWIFAIVLPLLLVVVLAEVADGGMDAKAIALLGVLTACGAALRPLSIDATGASPVFFLLIPAGRVLGRGFGFVLGTLTLFASALLTGGVGPWLPFQMLAAGWVGLFAGCLPPLRGKAEIAMLAAYGAAAGLLYGAITNLWFWPFETSGLSPQISYVPGASWATEIHHYAAFYIATSVGWDLTRALGNAILVLVAGRAVLLALRRAARRAAFAAPVSFVSPAEAEASTAH